MVIKRGNSEHISVLTGDLIGYTQSRSGSREYLTRLEEALELASQRYRFNHHIFRGDSFQGILPEPSRSLEAALLIRSYLLSGSTLKAGDGQRAGDVRVRHDARISVGIGTADFYDLGRIGESDGEAFRLSGHGLDGMRKRKQNLSIVTPWDEFNGELEVECALMDAIISKWTEEQSHSIFLTLQGLNQYQISERLGRTQSGISQRLSASGYWAIEKAMVRFEEKVKQNSDHLAPSQVR